MRTMKKLRLTRAQRDVLGRLDSGFVIREYCVGGDELSYSIILFCDDYSLVKVRKQLNKQTVFILMESGLIEETILSLKLYCRGMSGKWYELSAKGKKFIKGM